MRETSWSEAVRSLATPCISGQRTGFKVCLLCSARSWSKSINGGHDIFKAELNPWAVERWRAFSLNVLTREEQLKKTTVQLVFLSAVSLCHPHIISRTVLAININHLFLTILTSKPCYNACNVLQCSPLGLAIMHVFTDSHVWLSGVNYFLWM